MVICLDIESRFGAFNKPESTTGGLLTYKVVTKPVIKGILGAITGLGFEESLKTFEGLKVGVKPLNEIKTKSIVYNSHYGGRKGRMVNVRQELLIDPSYRIYLDFENVKETEGTISRIETILEDHGIQKNIDSLKTGVKDLLSNKISYYSLYMGKNDFPLEYTVKDFDIEEINDPEKEKFESTSIIPRDACSDFEVNEVSEEGSFGFRPKEPNVMKFHILSNYPVSQSKNRDYTEKKDFILKEKGQNIELIVEPDLSKKEYKYYKDEDNHLLTVF